MNEWLKLSKKRRVEILEQVNNRLGLPIQAVEKDWWVITRVSLRAEHEQ